jgi:2-polyprenyl-3-methyl-5-hydroxy-6-metoxy-1,4-benzoquinol methylase
VSTRKSELVALQETLYTSKNPTRKWLHTSRRDWVNSALKHCASGRSINRSIEIGPGAGGYLPLLSSLSEQVIAADIEQEYLLYAQERVSDLGNLQCATDDITHSRLPAGEFDLVLCTEVIEHIADSQSALMGLRRLLSPDGRLVLSTPQRYSPLEICSKLAFLPGIIELVRLVYREPIIPTGHINLLTEKELRQQLDKAGLVIVDAFKCGLYLPVIAEVMGRTGLKIEQWLERQLRGSWLDSLLWTQCYILKGKNSSHQV